MSISWGYATSVHVCHPQTLPFICRVFVLSKTVFPKLPFLRGQIVKWGHKFTFQDMVIPDKRSEQRGQEEYQKAHAILCIPSSENISIVPAMKELQLPLRDSSRRLNFFGHGGQRTWVIPLDTAITAIQSWLKIAQCIYGVRGAMVTKGWFYLWFYIYQAELSWCPGQDRFVKGWNEAHYFQGDKG